MFFLDKLKARGLNTVNLVVPDVHFGFQSDLISAFVGTTRQRRKVHFMRNILARISCKQKALIGKHLGDIFKQED